MSRPTSLLPTALLLTLAACAWKPPEPDPLEGWRPEPAPERGVKELVRGPAILQILPPVERTGAEQAALLTDPEAVAACVRSVTGRDDAAAVTVTVVRHYRGVDWVDVRFSLDDVVRRVRVAWFEGPEGLRIFRLIAPEADWRSEDLSAFQTFVRREEEASRPAEERKE
jgi:hypothetical protein